MTTLLATTNRALTLLRRLGYSHPTVAEPILAELADAEDISVGLIHQRGESPTGLQVWCTEIGRKQSVQITGLKNGVSTSLMHSLVSLLREAPPPEPATESATPVEDAPRSDLAQDWPVEIRDEIIALVNRTDVLSVDRGPQFVPRNNGAELRRVCLGRGYVIRNFRLDDGSVLQAHIIPDGVNEERLAKHLGMTPAVPVPESVLPPDETLDETLPTAAASPAPPVLTAPRPRIAKVTTQPKVRCSAPRRNTLQRTYQWFRSRTRSSVVAWVPTRQLHTAPARRLIDRALVIPTITCDDQTMVIVLRVPL